MHGPPFLLLACHSNGLLFTDVFSDVRAGFPPLLSLHMYVLLCVQKKAQDGLLQNMEMGGSAAWYNQDSNGEGPSPPPVAGDMERGTEPPTLDGVTPTASPKSMPDKLGDGKPGDDKADTVRIVAKSENPDLSYINSDALAARMQPADPPPPVRQPNKDSAQPGAWADVGLDD